jgi:hypothetical protein
LGGEHCAILIFEGSITSIMPSRQDKTSKASQVLTLLTLLTLSDTARIIEAEPSLHHTWCAYTELMRHLRLEQPRIMPMS